MTFMPSFAPAGFVSGSACVSFIGRVSSSPPVLCAETSPIAPGHANQLRQKNEARHRRLEELRRTLDSNEQDEMNVRIEKEYQGLVSLGDPYDPDLFTSDHAEFKMSHNEAFASLARNLGDDKVYPVFYLDGPDGGTTSYLLAAGFDCTDLYMANEWKESVSTLRSDPFHMPAEHCLLGRAQDVLRDDFVDVEFVAYYLDGCGGQTEPVMEMVSSILSRKNLAKRLAIGFTLTQAEPSGRELIDRVQDVTRYIMTSTKAIGYGMRHVGDDPESYGVNPELSRKHDGTCTSWVVCCESM
mmetsp:Transcript_22027/g.63157  ORF Transcript_22027/g.63157 Transcript_22027/m.63157 type:complete len:298 (-) Transcript_22027:1630-2523(-)